MKIKCLMCVFLFLSPVTSAQVPYQRILNAESEPGSWLTYSGSYRGHRFSQLAQITSANVANLKPIWTYRINARGKFETSPIVADGIMYVTEPPTKVTALDARTGNRLWHWQRPMPRDLKTIGFPPTNRGVAILDDSVFVGTLDGYLFALDAKSGEVRWQAFVADNSTGHSITVAPLAINGKIITGISGGEAGIRGFLDAYDAKTGKQLWRFWTIPGPGEPGHETWKGDSWKTGAGPTWVTGSYDPELDLIYWGTGNPGPDWNGDVRPGDNLYTCSLLAIDAKTGKLKWHFQFTPHDVHEWDATQVPVLINRKFKGRERKLVVTANRNAFYYALDRETGEFLHGAPFAKQTWAKGLDARGRPIRLPNTEPSATGTLVYPSQYGGTNWFSPSYSPMTGLFYVAVREVGAYYYKSRAEYVPGSPYLGGGQRLDRESTPSGAIRALEVETGNMKWEYRLKTPAWAGVLATAGGLVFSGSSQGDFFALDAQTGNLLWKHETRGFISANPVSFLVDGKQRVAIAAGRTLFVYGLEDAE